MFVAGDLLWYPVEGQRDECAAPDTMVVFGRPKGDRGSYKQWLEEGIGPQVVFEVLSPSIGFTEMARKLQFYSRHGVQEYYVYDPDRGDLLGWQRVDGRLELVGDMQGWVSPLLGVRFELEGADLLLFRPDGEHFATYMELAQQREAEQQARRAAEAQAAEAQAQATEAQARAERLAAQLRALGVEPTAE